MGNLPSIHTEDRFESEICADLASAGWLYTPPTAQAASPDAARYDRARALFPDDLHAWVQESQPQAWEQLEKSHGADARKVLMDRLRAALDTYGTLHVLHNGVDILGLRHPVTLAQFRPALAMNPDLQARYCANRLRVVRQVSYSLHNGNRLDLVFFLNGVPVATAEIKSDYTQSVEDAVHQYMTDRNPRVPRTNAVEPLLSFPGGALVHFALSNSDVRMTTQLAGMHTRFIPFNQGSNGPGVSGGAGNPPNPSGYATAYLWKDVLARDSWLDILGRYVVPEHDAKKRLARLIFPRYHQLDCTRKITGAVLADGPGDKYLIQHSAGSGKTHSIAWTANFLADLHDAQNNKVFDSVIVVSDRTVIDDQLQEALGAHERTKGVVVYIQGNEGSKSTELVDALSARKKIIACTLQTFPVVAKKASELRSTQGKRFAVIVDEAHSSQTDDTAAKLKLVLQGAARAIEENQGDIASIEDLANEALAAIMQAKSAGKSAGITYVGFTATPKDRTLQLFGTRPDPTRPANSEDNKPRPFHVYSMRQAIEEGFILDVLQNYTSYKTIFQIAHTGSAANKTVDESKATWQLMDFVRQHPKNVADHVQIVVEHFRAQVEPLLGHQAKAMVVTSGRLEAVRWQRAIQAYIARKGYDLRTLVAFSGDVLDPDLQEEALSEHSRLLNPTLGGRSIREAFSSQGGQRGPYALLLVADKFQTGFDEPLLCGLYIHKRLEGIAAVQTLSRLNRAYPGKDTTYIVDFVNDPDAILAAFKPYYETAELKGVTDPNVVYDLQVKLDATGYYTLDDVQAVAHAVVMQNTQSALDAVLVPLASRLLGQYRQAQHAAAAPGQPEAAVQAARAQMETLRVFKARMQKFVRLYAFLSQIVDYGNPDVEKRALFYKLLGRLLTFGHDIDAKDLFDLSEMALTYHAVRHVETRALPLAGGGQLAPTQPGREDPRPQNKTALEKVVQKLNALFVGEISEADKFLFVNEVIKARLLACETLVQQVVNNTPEQFANSPDLDEQILGAVMDALPLFPEMSKQALAAPARQQLKTMLLDELGLYEELRRIAHEKGREQNFDRTLRATRAAGQDYATP